MGKVNDVSRRRFVGPRSPLRRRRLCLRVRWQILRCSKSEEMK